MDDWKGVGLRERVVGENPHKRTCKWYKISMKQWPDITAIQKLFPCEAPESGYWREPISDTGSGHDKGTKLSELYLCHGLMFLQAVLPSHIESWRLPVAQIPRLSFNEPDSKFQIPVIHDNNFVQDWPTWYEWRKLERESPVALRMDMVLTVYHLLTKVLGVVDTSQSATKSRRKLTIHYAGAEKELNVIPLFSELALLIPNTDIVMVFFGQACKKLCEIAKTEKYEGCLARKEIVYHYTAPVYLGGSTFQAKLFGSEDLYSPEHAKPDALISENAGLFAYTTWQIAYSLAAKDGIPWGITEYMMNEVLEYEEHMVQWRDLAIYSSQYCLQHGLASQEKTQAFITNLSRAQARGAAMNPIMRPGLLATTSDAAKADNGFVLRVC
ncbi:hypothetical protein BDP27DRAFT_589347 [Rhodocollybia butyracea]|uniref:Mitochondrial splicing suppressor 51-like C-terminal domain-containing protein n=1 Tax=Rhodocollybia butyracea TaxID=206335 RepID=A0A9P5U946_9AGAR|nr:hypothetical protein BDP27DRAFT_589347 [Rhodocollybia butyracea]